MLIDLHCHALPRSQCSSLRPEELVDLARERGLDGICLAEHDAAWPADELADLRRRTGFVVLAAVELTTDRGHILAFGLPAGTGPLPTLAAAAAAAKPAGALLYLAHPARDGLFRIDHELVTACSSVEAINGSDSRLQNVAAKGLAHGFPLPGIGGSDAHTAAEVGRAATRFEARIEDEEGLLAALRSGAYEAVALG
ncbi:MAG: PHP domain-containing protein [Dehalococcoidia bacterium]|nr:PHP domain-containing protein [Dehalococcoidia bacterium]